MSDAPTDLSIRRRAVLQARIDRARRLLAQAEADARDNAESVAELRTFAEIMGEESDQGRDALAFADRMERDDAATLAAFREVVTEELRTVQVELDRLAGP